MLIYIMPTKKKWVLLHDKKILRDDYPDKILKILLKNRKITAREKETFLSPLRPKTLTPRMVGISKMDLDAAVKLIKKSKKFKIIIYGDYDADGLCASAILWEVLWSKGYDVIPFIPDREKDGYGINPQSVKKLKKNYPDLGLIITVDNGIVANKGVKMAKELGIKVIVTDHHLASGKPPDADVIVHSTKLAGSAVAWFLSFWLGAGSLELAALGTIADMLPLLGPNRSFVKYGLKEMARTKRVGLKTLKKKGKVDGEVLPWHVSFILAPRLNAAGRLSEAIDGLRLLCTKSSQKAKELADKLERINYRRQRMTVDGLKNAKDQVKDSSEKILFAIDSSYHPGIIGLIAGKLADEFHRPTIVISKGKTLSKGSARSVNGCNIIEMIRKWGKFLIDAGGHPMAAGFTIETKNIDKFVKQMTKSAKRVIKKEDLIPRLKIDFEINFDLISKKFYNFVQKLSPFGLGNPEPLFLVKGARVVRSQALGAKKQHLKIWLDDPGTKAIERVVAEAIGFGWGDFWNDLVSGDLVDLVASLSLNRWQGRETLQLKIKDIRKAVTV